MGPEMIAIATVSDSVAGPVPNGHIDTAPMRAGGEIDVQRNQPV